MDKQQTESCRLLIQTWKQSSRLSLRLLRLGALMLLAAITAVFVLAGIPDFSSAETEISTDNHNQIRKL